MLEKLMVYFEYPFVRYALIAAVLIALCSSLLGVTLVLKKIFIYRRRTFPCGFRCNGSSNGIKANKQYAFNNAGYNYCGNYSLIGGKKKKLKVMLQ